MFRLIEAIKPYSKYFLVTWIIIILTMSSIPSLPTLKIQTQKSEIRLDYLIHFIEYGSLAFLAFLTYADTRFRMSLIKFLIITAALIFLAVFDEFHQKLIPGRTFNVKDICSNLIGIVVALVFCIVVFRYSGKNHREN